MDVELLYMVPSSLFLLPHNVPHIWLLRNIQNFQDTGLLSGVEYVSAFQTKDKPLLRCVKYIVAAPRQDLILVLMQIKPFCIREAKNYLRFMNLDYPLTTCMLI